MCTDARMDSAWIRRCDDFNCDYRRARRVNERRQRHEQWLKENRPRAIEKLKRVAATMYHYTEAQAASKTVINLREALELEAKIDEEKARKDWL